MVRGRLGAWLVLFTTIQCWKQRYQPVGGGTEESQSRFPISSWPMFIGSQQCQLERVPNALGARRREFPRRYNFRDSNDVEFSKDIAKSFADRCRSRLTLKMSNATLSKLSTTKMSIFHFHEKSFASYDKFVDSKRFTRLLRTDLPLRSCLYDTSN